MNDTIVAIASGLVNQPVSIIRVSGPDAFEIVSKIYTGVVGKHQVINYGNIMDKNSFVDEVLVSSFVNPKSFTGEDVVEIYAHGGLVVTNKILRMILNLGARHAERGEFSRRAFLNGKMTLVKAEAIHSLIFAKTEEQAKIATKGFDGATNKLITNLKDELLELIAICETNIDYPEYEDIEQLTNEKLLPILNNLVSKYDGIINSSKRARVIINGINVAIVGKPNAGKSSLLNALLNEDKAIVSATPGTTRDIVEGQIQVGQLLINLKDTAGIRDTKDEIENIGVKKSYGAINNADIVIHLIEQGDKDELEIKVDPSKCIKVYNKSDISSTKGQINISAKNGDINQLIDELKNRFMTIDLNDEKILSNERQLSLVEKSKESLDECINGLNQGFEPDTIIIDLRSAWESLAQILGQAGNDKLLDEMFSKFCLGK